MIVPAPTQGNRRRRRRGLRALVAVAIALAVLVVTFSIVGSLVTLPLYALSPGAAPPVHGLIAVPEGLGVRPRDRIMFTYVEEGRVRLIDWIPDKLDPNIHLISAKDILGLSPPSQLVAQGILQMAQAEQAARVASARALGFTVPGTPIGGLVDLIAAKTPAIRALAVGDVITSIDGVPTPGPAQVAAAIHAQRPGATVTVAIVPFAATNHRAGAVATKDVRVTLTHHREGGRRVAYLGVALDPAPAERFTLPFSVSVNPGSVGGPSAGLAITLGIIDTLTSGNLSGRVPIAATGTIDPQGQVGDVGGVAQKAVAVSAAGAKVFLVPPAEVAQARSHVAAGVRVVGVSTLTQALRVLQGLRCPAKVTARRSSGASGGSSGDCALVPPMHARVQQGA